MKTTKSLLTTENAKTSKGTQYGYLTSILYMAPSNIADPSISLCPMSKIAECHKACLYSAGRGKFSNVQEARIRKALFFIKDQARFMDLLVKDIYKAIARSKKLNLKPIIRLNGTTDIMWERIPTGTHANVFEQFPEVQFYDYTKLAIRLKTTAHIPNYDLTFSYSGVQKYQKQVEMAQMNLENSRMAVVFRSTIPTEWHGYKVVDGDSTDLRFLDEKNVVVGLKAKGSAKQDFSGFVQD